jgi:hypothetical protein
MARLATRCSCMTLMLAMLLSLLDVACSRTKDTPRLGTSDTQATAQDRVPRHDQPERQASWRTYRNVQFGYELRYPSDAVPDTTDPTAVRFEFIRAVRVPSQPGSTVTADYTFKIEASANPARLSPAEWFSHEDSLSDDHRLSKAVEKMTPVVIDNQRGLSYLLYAGDARITYVFLCAFDSAYEITYEASVSGTRDDFAAFKPVYETMLHSLRFAQGR